MSDVVVVDWGSHTWKVGFTRKGPTTFPSPAGAVRDGLISDWQSWRCGLRRVCAILNVTPVDDAFLFCTSTELPENQRIQLEQTAYELGIRKCCILQSPPLVLCNTGSTTGLVIDIGHLSTTVTAVHNNIIIDHLTTVKLSGLEKVEMSICELFRQKYSLDITKAEAASILQQHGKVATSPKQFKELVRPGGSIPLIWRGASQGYDVTEIVLKSTEEMFLTMTLGQLAHDVIARLFSSDFSKYSQIITNVMICGGGSDLLGVVDRFRYELRPWPKLRIANQPEFQRGIFNVWAGGAQLSQNHGFLLNTIPPALPTTEDVMTALPVTSLPTPRVEPPNPALIALESRQKQLEKQLSELTREKLRADSKIADLQTVSQDMSIKVKEEVRKVATETREEIIIENRKANREQAGIAHAVQAARAGDAEELRKIVSQLQANAERTRVEQSQREVQLVEALKAQSHYDSLEIRKMAESAVMQAASTREQQAESESKLLDVLQSLLAKQEEIQRKQQEQEVQSQQSHQTTASNSIFVPKSPTASHKTITVASRQSLPEVSVVASSQNITNVTSNSNNILSNQTLKESIVGTGSVVSVGVHPYQTNRNISPSRNTTAIISPPVTVVGSGAATATPTWRVVQQKDVAAPVPPARPASPPPSSNNSPTRVTDFWHEGFPVTIHEAGRANEPAVIISRYEGNNPNLLNRDMWWVRGSDNAKKLRSYDSLVPRPDYHAGNVLENRNVNVDDIFNQDSIHTSTTGSLPSFPSSFPHLNAGQNSQNNFYALPPVSFPTTSSSVA